MEGPSTPKRAKITPKEASEPDKAEPEIDSHFKTAKGSVILFSRAALQNASRIQMAVEEAVQEGRNGKDLEQQDTKGAQAGDGNRKDTDVTGEFPSDGSDPFPEEFLNDNDVTGDFPDDSDELLTEEVMKTISDAEQKYTSGNIFP